MKSSIKTLKAIVSLALLVVPLLVGRAQTESANIYNYTPQPGFRKSNLEGKTEFYFKKNKKWVIIDLFDIRPSSGNAAEDAQNDWNEIVKNNYLIKGDIVTENQEQNGWQVTAQTAIASTFRKINLSLITFSCPIGHASILLINNDFENVLDNEIGTFIGSLSLVSPTEAASYINPGENIPVTGINTTQPDPNYQMPGLTNPPAPQTDSGNYSPQSGNFDTPLASNPYNPPFPSPGEQSVKASVMMDVGWFVEATNDYMQYTKPDIKVLEYFLTETPYPNKDQYWQQVLSRYFTADTYYYPETGPSYFSFEFAWADAVYKANGKNYFIAWLVDYNVPAAYLAICSSESVFRTHFPENKMLGEMQRFNNFPVSLQAIQGEWKDSNFGGAQMYEVNTGNYAGMAMASSASSYTFSGTGFRFFSQGATGMAGTAKPFQIEETGDFTVDGYNLVTHTTKRTDQMTNTTVSKQEEVDYSVAFKFTKNAKILFMQNKKYTGMTYNLVKK